MRDERFVHQGNGRKRPMVEPERAAMPEMRVAGEKDRHDGRGHAVVGEKALVRASLPSPGVRRNSF
jgi:hypothetical protein